MDHHQLVEVARKTAEAVNAAVEGLCRAIMLYEQQSTLSIGIPNEMSHDGIVNLTKRLHKVQEEVAEREKTSPSAVDSHPQSKQVELAPPGTFTELLRTRPSEPNLKSYMDKAGWNEDIKRQMLRETLPTSTQNVYPTGPQTYEEAEQKDDAPVSQQVVKQYSKENVWKHFLSPLVVEGGCGVIEPGFKGLKMYKADLNLVASMQVAEQNWPSGFYSASKDAKDIYFLYNGETAFHRVLISTRRPVQQFLLHKQSPANGWLPLADELMYEFPVTSEISASYRAILDWASTK